MDNKSWELHRTISINSGKNKCVPSFVFLAHVVDIRSSTHVQFIPVRGIHALYHQNLHVTLVASGICYNATDVGKIQGFLDLILQSQRQVAPNMGGSSLWLSGVYSLCDRPGISRGPYFAIATICSVSSLIFVSLKASYVFSGLNYNYGGAYGRAMEIALFLSSWILAIGHIVVAYRISCRERRKLLVYKIDIEAVSLMQEWVSKVSKSSRPVQHGHFPIVSARPNFPIIRAADWAAKELFSGYCSNSNSFDEQKSSCFEFKPHTGSNPVSGLSTSGHPDRCWQH